MNKRADFPSIRDIPWVGDGWYCVSCEQLCQPYDEGIACGCGEPWETEKIDQRDYPASWIPVDLLAVRKDSGE